MFSFIRRHWIVYVVGAVIAVGLGLWLAFFVGEKGSTPEREHAAEVQVETGSAPIDFDATDTDGTLDPEATDGAAEGDAAAEGETAEGDNAA
ncbi:hypothetical protein QUW40_09270 [Collinsella tanakaei]|uniref:hypothetical protein n=1 Tax=Collinsella tanakaei TaxID=626935 RepID=UPI0025A40476|nr:hypothetical protein [Collinsella tanakaei]MDM8246785.1 hypothetical protein [Collinsella tanakaei]